MVTNSLGKWMPYVLHLPGKGKRFLGHLLQSLKENIVQVDDSISVVTVATENVIDSCPLVYQLEKSGSKYINPAKNYSGEWKKLNKLKFVVEALQDIPTEYVFLLDANDAVLLKDINKDFISKWKEYKCDILFNGSQYLYPDCISASIEKVHDSPYVNHYLNAGVCFGYTDKIKELYKLAEERTKVGGYYPIDSEQYYVRISIIESYNIKVKIDDSSNLFLLSHGN